MALPYRWTPSGTDSTYGRPPEVGKLVAYEHAVYRVVSVELRPEDLWTDEHRKAVAYWGITRGGPHAVVLRPIGASDDPKDWHRDQHFQSFNYDWHVYRDEHYPMCAQCHEPLPCRDLMAERVSASAAQRLARFDTPGICPACSKPVTTRQKGMTFADNLELPGGPPVTYHVGQKGCRRSAADYEERWAKAAPETRKATLTCPGDVINHNDGTYECSAAKCPGPDAYHQSYTTCRDPECHENALFDCHPAATAKRRPTP